MKKTIIKRLKFCLATGQVTEVAEEFYCIPGVTNNGSHYQLAGYVLASVGICAAGGGFINLNHPDTKPGHGILDVGVLYDADCLAPKFCYGADTNHQFVPMEDHVGQLKVWPSGPRVLLKVVMAIEDFVEKDGFRPALQLHLLNLMHQAELVPA